MGANVTKEEVIMRNLISKWLNDNKLSRLLVVGIIILNLYLGFGYDSNANVLMAGFCLGSLYMGNK
jgi:hypothetical protein